jgi:hypothetical protein
VNVGCLAHFTNILPKIHLELIWSDEVELIELIAK